MRERSKRWRRFIDRSYVARCLHLRLLTMFTRRRAVGAELTPAGVDFRVWAPGHDSVSVVIDGNDHRLTREPDGHFRGLIETARAGSRYRFRINDDEATYPDPASRFQP